MFNRLANSLGLKNNTQINHFFIKRKITHIRGYWETENFMSGRLKINGCDNTDKVEFGPNSCWSSFNSIRS